MFNEEIGVQLTNMLNEKNLNIQWKANVQLKKYSKEKPHILGKKNMDI